jgi:outer membrane protein assembly factor BamE (lipoprotein component of BamABCDE complex)
MFNKKVIKIIFILISLSSVAFIIFMIYGSQKGERIISVDQNKQTTRVPADLSQITPGKSTKGDVVYKLGKPNKESENEDVTILYYNSTSKTRDSQITISQDIVVLIKEMLTYSDPKKVSDIEKTYGLSNYSLFGPDYAGGNKLYIYPAKGIAYLGDPKFDTIDEIWYFESTSIEIFKQKFASNYTQEKVLNLY